MKGKMKRLLSIFLTSLMILGTMPMAVFSVENNIEITTTDGYYSDGVWNAGGDGTLTHDINGTEVILSKKATPVDGEENTFEINLRVETSTTTTHHTNSGAVVLVFDTSGSMDYCAECGSRNSLLGNIHKNSCSSSGYVSNNQSRMAAAKKAAISFMESYAGTDASANRQIAVVSFAKDYKTVLNWVNVAGGEGNNSYDSVVNAINGLSANGGTNLDGGLLTANDILDNDTVKDISYKSVIVMTDGVPTYYVGQNGRTTGNGSTSSAACNSATANRATAIKNKNAFIYTVCFGAENDVTYPNGPTVGNFLKNSVATSADTAYNAADAKELMNVFESITEDITEGLNGMGWSVVDPMTPVSKVAEGAPANFTTEDGHTYKWTLSNAETTVDGDVTTYVYTCTYRIHLDVQIDGFVEGQFYPTNEPTYLMIDGESYAFPVPGVKGTLPRTSVSVTKEWNDADNQDNIRADHATVQLYENGTAVGDPVVLSADNNWSNTWTDLIEMSNGKMHLYTVEELDVPADYTPSYSGEGTTSLVVTNNHSVYKTDITVTKIWDDNDNQDGIRPSVIVVNLFKNGVQVDAAEITADKGWSHTFRGFDVNTAGVANVYTVEEVPVDGYTSSVDGFIITNSHDIETTEISVSKIWDDNDDQDGIRPNDITVSLIKNGEATDKTITLSQGNGWSDSFIGIDKYENGQKIEYSVVETSVPGYTTEIAGDQYNGYIITNTHTPETVEVSGSKTWIDNNDQDGARPDSITINLLKNGEIIDSKTVTADSDWTYTFANLPKYENQGTLVNYSVTENVVDGYTTEYNGSNIINTHAPEKTSVTVSKVWDDNNDQDGIRPNDIIVKLLANGKDTGKTLTLSVGSWTASFSDLDKYEAGQVITYTVAEVSVDGYTTEITGDQTVGYTITNTHTPETIEVSGSKTWIDNDNQDGKRPETIIVNLLKNGVQIDAKFVSAESDWTYTFVNLPKYEDHGTLINYSVTEDVVDGYTTEYNGSNIINTHAPEKTSVTVSKVWEDSNNQDGIRPNDVTVKLLANGKDTGKTLVLSEGNNWTASFSDLDKFEAGNVITYTVAEVSVGGYETVISGDQTNGYTITNSHTPETVVVSGSKTWNDNDDQDGARPDSITVNLLKNGAVIESKTVTEADDWAWAFENLPKFENEGTLVNYSVTEDVVDGYTTEYNGSNIINTHAPEKTSVTVSKVWADNNDQDGIRANEITVKLLANGVDTGKTLILSQGNNWTDSFTELDKFEAGVEIVYTVDEIAIDGYTTVISGDQTTGYTITNSHTPETVVVSGSKTWDDNDDQDGARPDSITVNLLKNGEIIDSKTVTEADGWAYAFENLPKYENHGTLISYSVTENAVEDYSTEYNGYNITNTHAPAKISVTVSKTWADNDDQDGIRPNDITVKLLANGVDTGKTLTLSQGNNWTDSFTELDKFEAGVEIVYTVDEIAIDGYTTVISGSHTEGFAITNSHTPETVEVAGSKTWDDNDDQDGARPDSITINLLKNGEVIDTKTVTEADDWAWAFENLPKYENHGTLISYSVTETAVDGYSTEYNGYNVTNTHAPEKTSVTVTKAWEDNNDQDGIRANDVIVKLLANGKDTGKTLVLSEGNNWTASFAELDKFEAGVEIVYTVDEIAIEGYSTVISGDQTVGYTITNSHTPETVEVAGSKTWDDNDNQDGARPDSITINLLKNGEVIDTKTVTEADDWAWAFTNLPKYENKGTLITYSITENAVEDYSAEYDGFNVTNTHTPEEISITVTKAWEDNNDQDGIRPDSITVKLLANGEETGDTLELNADNNWTASFTELAKFEDGKEIVYTVAEVEVEGYTTVIDGSHAEGFTITNSHTPETVEVAGSKTWNDNDNQDGVRPDSITVNLLKNGEVIDSKVVTEADGWAWTFADLPKYENNGTLITYSITENAVEDYSTEYDGYNIINTHTPGETSITVSKAWADDNDQDGIRPDKVTIKLLADGKDTGITLELSEANKWTGSFTEIPVKANGKDIEYTIEEIAVKGYNTVISGDMEHGFTVTNSHTVVPQTGDSRDPGTWFMFMALSGVAFLLTGFYSKKRKKATR